MEYRRKYYESKTEREWNHGQWMGYCNALIKLARTIQEFYVVFSVSPPRSGIFNLAFSKWYELSCKQLKNSITEEEIARAWEYSPDGLLQTSVDSHLRYYIFMKLRGFYLVDNSIMVMNRKNIQKANTGSRALEYDDGRLDDSTIQSEEPSDRLFGWFVPAKIID